VSDYRPVLNSTASTVIFERTIGSSTKLYSLDLTSPSATPVLFVPGLKAQSFRADWSWQTGEVVFMNSNGIYLSSDPTKPIAGTSNMTYPTWYPDGATLAVYNNRTHHPNALPIPRTSKMDLTGTVLQQVLANNTIWAGFPSVNQTNSNQIAFAGRVVVPKGSYNQNKNYIWLTDTSTTPPTVRTPARELRRTILIPTTKAVRLGIRPIIIGSLLNLTALIQRANTPFSFRKQTAAAPPSG
jgi:hypothetical protein